MVPGESFYKCEMSVYLVDKIDSEGEKIRLQKKYRKDPRQQH